MRPREAAKAADEAKARFAHIDGEPFEQASLTCVFLQDVTDAACMESHPLQH